MLSLLARYPLLGSPRTLSALAAVTALVAGLLLGTQEASAGMNTACRAIITGCR